eukprot:UC4_evm9s575
MYEIGTGHLPFMAPSDENLVSKFRFVDMVIEGRRPSLCKNEAFLPSYKSLMEMCWSGEPSLRPTFSNIVTSLGEIIQLDQSENPKIQQLPQQRRANTLQSTSRLNSKNNRLLQRSNTASVVGPRISPETTSLIDNDVTSESTL